MFHGEHSFVLRHTSDKGYGDALLQALLAGGITTFITTFNIVDKVFKL